MELHVDPSAVLLVQSLVGIRSALLQEGVGDLVVNVLLHVLVRELHMAVQVLKAGGHAEPEQLLSSLSSSSMIA